MIDLKLNSNEKSNLTNDEIELAIARKLEILILPVLKRNIKFFYAGGNLKGKADAYRNQTDENEVEKILSGNKKYNNLPTVCKPLCDMVAKILRQNGINAETVSCDTDIFKHTDVLITTKSNKKYIINYLEDIENIQTGMKTPDFASKKYYERRYKKFENSQTTDGKSLDNIAFLDEKALDKIDTNLGYKKYGMYMNETISQIKKEFLDFKSIMAENEYLTKQLDLEKETNVTKQQLQELKDNIYEKYSQMTEDEELEEKMDWIFNYFNERMNIKGHTDFVMYYSRLLLKEVLSNEEYSKLKRYDCFAYNDKIPNNSKIKDILDYTNSEENNKNRFCMIKFNDKAYLFSTKPNAYLKINEEEIEEMESYTNMSESARPSDLMLYLCDRGNALPLVFHPLGSKILNERAELIDKNLTEQDRKNAIEELSKSIKTTDEPITSIYIPYPNGRYKKIYINSNDEFVEETADGEKIYHYNEETDDFEIEKISKER